MGDHHSVIWHVQDLTVTETTAAVARGFGGGFGLEYVAFLRHITTRIRFEDLDRRPIDVPNGDIHHRNETLLGPGGPEAAGHDERRPPDPRALARAGRPRPRA